MTVEQRVVAVPRLENGIAILIIVDMDTEGTQETACSGLDLHRGDEEGGMVTYQFPPDAPKGGFADETLQRLRI